MSFDQFNPAAKYSKCGLQCIWRYIETDLLAERWATATCLVLWMHQSDPRRTKSFRYFTFLTQSVSRSVRHYENDDDWRMVEPFGVLSKDPRWSFSLGTRQTGENRNQIVFQRTISYTYQSSLSISFGSLHQSTVSIGLWTTPHGFVHLLRCQSRISNQRSRQRIEQEDKSRQKHQSNLFERDLRERDERLS